MAKAVEITRVGGFRSDSFLLALLPISGKLTNKSGRQVAGKVGN